MAFLTSATVLPRFSSLWLPSGSALGARSNGRIHERRRARWFSSRREEFGAIGRLKFPSRDTERSSSRDTDATLGNLRVIQLPVVARWQHITRIPRPFGPTRRARARAPIYGACLAFMAAASKYAPRNPRSARCFMHAPLPPPFSFSLFAVPRLLESSPLSLDPLAQPLPSRCSISPGRPPLSLSDPSRLISLDSRYPATRYCIPCACLLILVRYPLFGKYRRRRELLAFIFPLPSRSFIKLCIYVTSRNSYRTVTNLFAI